MFVAGDHWYCSTLPSTTVEPCIKLWLAARVRGLLLGRQRSSRLSRARRALLIFRLRISAVGIGRPVKILESSFLTAVMTRLRLNWGSRLFPWSSPGPVLFPAGDFSDRFEPLKLYLRSHLHSGHEK